MVRLSQDFIMLPDRRCGGPLQLSIRWKGVCFHSVADANETRGRGHRPTLAVTELPLSLAQGVGSVLASCQSPVESNHERGGLDIRNGHDGRDELLGAKRQQGGAESEQLVTGADHRPAGVACREDHHRGHSVQPFQVEDGEWPVG
jgi:hypothetical protein